MFRRLNCDNNGRDVSWHLFHGSNDELYKPLIERRKLAATCLLYGGLEIDFFNSFSTFRPSINKIIVPITTKIWPKNIGKNFGSTQNYGTVSTKFCFSIDKF